MCILQRQKNFCLEMFCVELNNSLLQLIFTNLPLHCKNFNKTFDNFVKTTSQIINKHAPLKQLSRKQQKLAKKTWITKGILTSIQKKNIIFQLMLINGNETEKKCFERYSNKLSKLKTLSKKMYFQNELSKCKKKVRKTWEIIKSTLPNSSCCHFPNSIKINDTTTENPTTILNEFNNYFCSIGSKLADNISGKIKKKP